MVLRIGTWKATNLDKFVNLIGNYNSRLEQPNQLEDPNTPRPVQTHVQGISWE